MLAINLERGRDNMVQTELPSYADAIFGTVGGLCTKQRSQAWGRGKVPGNEVAIPGSSGYI